MKTSLHDRAQVWLSRAALVGRALRRPKPAVELRHVDLSVLLSEFARTLLTDFPIQEILDHLVDLVVDALPVTAVGVTLISPGASPHYIAASDAAALRFEKLQTEFGEGPCMQAYLTGAAVSVPDLREEERFPRFSSAALAGGLAAAFTFPLRHDDGRLGALDLYRDVPGPLTAADLEVAQTLADVAAAYILNAQAREAARIASDRFRSNSLHDALTGLPNRALLQQRLEHAAKRAERSHSYAAVLFTDLDRFKDINDTYGHQVGDELLIAVARRLAALVRPGDTLARVSGDEFVFLCEDLREADDIQVLAERIGDALMAPFEHLGHHIVVGASVGMAYAGPGEAITDQLVVDADVAMYEAKRKSKETRQILDLRHARIGGERLFLEKDLRSAFAHGKLTVDYQPIVRGEDGLVTGVEALLRWTHPDSGPVPALQLVRIAESHGLIGEIGAWVLESSCQAHRRWHRAFPEVTLDLAVNVSVRQLLAEGFVSCVREILERTEIDPRRVVLEVTEGIFIHNASRAIAVLSQLRGLGVRLALDDFGTGYSSLAYLRQFPVDILKVDRSFVANLGDEPATVAIVTAVVGLAAALGLDVVAEGVETTEQQAELTGAGCQWSQGFLFSPALPETELTNLLRDHEAGELYLPTPAASLAG